MKLPLFAKMAMPDLQKNPLNKSKFDNNVCKF